MLKLKLEEQLRYGDIFTIYIIYKYYLYRRYIGRPVEDFSYLHLQLYYNKFKFKIVPRHLEILHWHSIERNIRRLASEIKPPLLVRVGNGFFKPTKDFWSYIQERIESIGSFWPKQYREVNRY
jgi:hypothetical protein